MTISGTMEVIYRFLIIFREGINMKYVGVQKHLSSSNSTLPMNAA
jgi:hypothetical protein